MTKFIIIILIVIGLAILGITYIMKSARKFFSAFQPADQQQKSTFGKKKNHENVIYDKDDVVVMKGDAKKDKKDKDRSGSFFNIKNEENEQ